MNVIFSNLDLILAAFAILITVAVLARRGQIGLIRELVLSLVVNAVVLELASFFSRNIFHAGIYVSGFGAAVLGAVVISVVGTLVSGAIN